MKALPVYSLFRPRFALVLTLVVIGMVTGRLTLCAQTPADPGRTFRILTVVSYIPDLLYDAAGHKSLKLEISARPFASYPIPSDNHLVIYKEIPPPPEAPPGTPPRRLTMAEAVLPARAQRVLVVLIPEGESVFRTIVIEDNPADHPAAHLRLINFSKMNVAASLNEKPYQLAPGGSTMAEWSKGGVLVQVAAQKGGQWKLAFRKERLAQPNTRGYGLIFDYVYDPAMDDDPQAPPPATVRFFSENVPPPANGR